MGDDVGRKCAALAGQSRTQSRSSILGYCRGQWNKAQSVSSTKQRGGDLPVEETAGSMRLKLDLEH